MAACVWHANWPLIVTPVKPHCRCQMRLKVALGQLEVVARQSGASAELLADLQAPLQVVVRWTGSGPCERGFN